MKLNLHPQDLSQITGGVWSTPPVSGRVDHLIIDSRRSFDPENTIFLAIKGKKSDGHHFIGDLYKKGVRWFIVTKDLVGSFPEAHFLIVEDAIEALQKIAEKHRKKFNYPVVGITGSNGKTIAKEWIYDLVKTDFNVIRSPKSYNSQLGVPLSVLEMTKEHNLALFEAGISKPGEMEKLQKIIDPDIGVFTHPGTAHIENFKGRDHLYSEKSLLFSSCKTVIVPKELESFVKGSRNIIYWNENSDNHHSELKDDKLHLQFKDHDYFFKLVQQDKATLENTLAAVHTAIILGAHKENIAQNAEKLEMPALRLEVIDGLNHCQLINDTYNNDFSGLQSAVDFHRQQMYKSHILILSELGGSTRKKDEQKKLVHWINRQEYLDEILLVGTSFNEILDVINHKKKSVVANVKELLSLHKDWKNASILIKGSREHQLEKFTFSYSATPHEALLTINLEAIRNNLNYFKGLINEDVKVMAMVKASAYGGGIEKMGSFLENERIDALGVAYANEGVQLRDSGVNVPIMVLNPSPSEYNLMVKNNLEPAIGSLYRLDRFIKALIIEGVQNYPVHIELESGMHRLGMTENELEELVNVLKSQPEVKVASTFSHLSASDDPDENQFTKTQIDSFNKMAHQLAEQISYSFPKHICNSQGVLRFKEAHFDMVRLGIGLYGYGNKALEPAFSMFASVSQIKHILPGDSVSYGRTFKADQEMQIAVISIGYADGLRKALSNGKWCFLWKGKQLPIIGQICMDMCMVDVTGCNIEEGESVQVFGPGNQLEEMAKVLNTIPYEILTGISNRIMRVYES